MHITFCRRCWYAAQAINKAYQQPAGTSKSKPPTLQHPRTNNKLSTLPQRVAIKYRTTHL